MPLLLCGLRCGAKTVRNTPKQTFFEAFAEAAFQKETPSYSQGVGSYYDCKPVPKRKQVGDSASRQTGKLSAQPQGANRNNNKQHY
jgi:hypothetical protein